MLHNFGVLKVSIFPPRGETMLFKCFDEYITVYVNRDHSKRKQVVRKIISINFAQRGSDSD